MIHNAWAEMSANAKLFYDAFRGLCRMRIAYAIEKNSKYTNLALSGVPDEIYDSLLKQAEFWLNVQEYWEGKLKLSYQWEKDYFESENEKSLDSEV